MSRRSDQYRGLFDSVREYWQSYGGQRALWTSPLLHASFLLTGISYGFWSDGGWYPITVSIVSNLLGFSLGTYTLVFTLLSPSLKRALSETKDDNNCSYFDSMNATFMHFIAVQVIALTFAIIYKATLIADFGRKLLRPEAEAVLVLALSTVGNFIGFLLLSYSILSVFGASLSVFRLAKLANHAD